jgi:hypothetical protein
MVLKLSSIELQQQSEWAVMGGSGTFSVLPQVCVTIDRGEFDGGRSSVGAGVEILKSIFLRA